MESESIIERAIQSAQEIVSTERAPLSETEARRQSLELVNGSEIAMVGSNAEAGYPNIKAMFKIRSDSLYRVWFSTNTSSRRVAQFRRDPRTCVYFHDPEHFAGLLLVGVMETILDLEAKRSLWREGWEAYYPKGMGDPEYCILRFSPHLGNYYQALQNVNFRIDQDDRSIADVQPW